MNKRALVVVLLIVSVMVGVLVGVWGVEAQGGSQDQLAPLPAAATHQPTSDEQKVADLYQRVTQSVVNISVVTATGGGTGSGFVIDTEGHIVTNNHVADGANTILVTFVDGTILEAKLVGNDPDADLAVIKVDPSQVTLQPVTFADSDKVFVGQRVFAIGSPFGEDFTLTEGIVSALDRSLQNANSFSIPELIQTDAAINPGNSGGPLLDQDGNVIGVNTAIASNSNSGSGVGFSIPSNSVRRIAPYLIANGSYQHSWLGISGSTLLAPQRDAMNLDSSVHGVIVGDVSNNSPASKAGLQGSQSTIKSSFGQLAINGDVITAINNTPITQMSDLIDYLESSTHPGDVVDLTIVRNGNTQTLSVTLAPRP